ncbi:MAG: hypothetical protein IJ748_00605, partial [Bacteroidales bacterium]|nr:hypothetical protein [Bacteroidales bacterium]
KNILKYAIITPLTFIIGGGICLHNDLNFNKFSVIDNVMNTSADKHFCLSVLSMYAMQRGMDMALLKEFNV